MVSSSIFKVFGMTRPGIEPRSPGSLANTLTAGPIYIYVYICNYSNKVSNVKEKLHRWWIWRMNYKRPNKYRKLEYILNPLKCNIEKFRVKLVERNTQIRYDAIAQILYHERKIQTRGHRKKFLTHFCWCYNFCPNQSQKRTMWCGILTSIKINLFFQIS